MKSLNQKRMPAVDPTRFAMVPKSDVPRSTFHTTHSYKSTFDMGYLVPVHVDEVLPGDVHRGEVTVFARLNNLLFPLMDALQLETFFFFVPSRLVWTNWKKFMGEQAQPGDSISYTVPQLASSAGGFAVGSLYDYFGLPTVGQVGGGNVISVNALPIRAYALTYNEWFRDENLEAAFVTTFGDGPDAEASYSMKRRGKRHDYFTSCLPWPLKGGVEVPMPLSGTADVTPRVIGGSGSVPTFRNSGATTVYTPITGTSPAFNLSPTGTWGAGEVLRWGDPALVADLSTATGATINAMRLSVATQQFLEKNARGGTRYTEILRNHFGVMPEDFRLQRPEYIGGGVSSIQTSAIPQTSATGVTGSSTPVGSLTAQATAAGQHRFQYHAKEHGYIIGIVNVRADLTYQQGLHRMWSRETRYDFYWPTFANLGEQAVLNKEIYCTGAAADDDVFGYQERWAEYRYRPSRITGLFRSTSSGNIDEWHMAQQFTALPTLGSTFIRDTPPASRVLAAGASANGMQVLFDSVFSVRCTRAMPTYSVPGLARF